MSIATAAQASTKGCRCLRPWPRRRSLNSSKTSSSEPRWVARSGQGPLTFSSCSANRPADALGAKGSGRGAAVPADKAAWAGRAPRSSPGWNGHSQRSAPPLQSRKPDSTSPGTGFHRRSSPPAPPDVGAHDCGWPASFFYSNIVAKDRPTDPVIVNLDRCSVCRLSKDRCSSNPQG